jgi:hypothetical protein
VASLPDQIAPPVVITTVSYPKSVSATLVVDAPGDDQRSGERRWGRPGHRPLGSTKRQYPTGFDGASDALRSRWRGLESISASGRGETGSGATASARLSPVVCQRAGAPMTA